MTSWVSTDQGRHLRRRRKTDTAPEILLRKALHAAGARFRLHRRLASGCTPDIVFPSRRLAVFVDGDYWHSCPVHGRATPFTGPNAALWEEKMRRNAERDRRATRLAQELGWRVVRVWECAVRADPQAVARVVLRGDTPPRVPTLGTSGAPGPPRRSNLRAESRAADVKGRPTGASC